MLAAAAQDRTRPGLLDDRVIASGCRYFVVRESSTAVHTWESCYGDNGLLGQISSHAFPFSHWVCRADAPGGTGKGERARNTQPVLQSHRDGRDRPQELARGNRHQDGQERLPCPGWRSSFTAIQLYRQRAVCYSAFAGSERAEDPAIVLVGRSSSGPGHRPLKAEIRGSNPLRPTNSYTHLLFSSLDRPLAILIVSTSCSIDSRPVLVFRGLGW